MRTMRRRKIITKKSYKFNYSSIKLKKGLKVLVIAGDDRGKTGDLQKFFRKTGQVLIEGVNIQKKSIKKTAQAPGQFFRMSKPIHVSNIKVLDDSGKPISLRKIKRTEKKQENKESSLLNS